MIAAAKEAAYAAGEILLKNFRKVTKNEIRKKARNDFLSFVDENSEKTIISILKKEFPQHSILAEETGLSSNENDYQWIIDPLDGTTNYLAGIPVFAVSIGLQYKKELILGVIYDPIHDELFWAEKGSGAFINDDRITVSGAGRLDESLIATGFPFKLKHLVPEYLEAWKSIFEPSIGMRRMGAAAIDLAYIAAGRFDGFWEIGLSPWDMAAGALIIREAGGMVTDFWNKDHFLNSGYIAADNGRIHDELITKIQEVFPFYKSVKEGI
jgi:myo-inositol-1(or 4)-monophosphatase